MKKKLRLIVEILPLNDQRHLFGTGDDWGDVIRNYVIGLEPRPTHVVLNARIWGILDEDNIVSLVQAEQETGMHLIWKTTTATAENTYATEVPAFDALMCRKLNACAA